MGAIFQNALNTLKNFWTGMTRGDKIRLVSIVGGIIILSVVIVVILSRTTYAVIYNGTAEEAGVIAEYLRGQGETVKTQGSGTVLVPEERLSDLSMSLAAEGFSSAGYNTDYISQASGLGMTDSDKREYQKFQLQENIRTHLKQLSMVEDCLVLLTKPEASSYARTGRTEEISSAAVTIQVAPGMSFTSSDAETVRSIVSAGSGVPLENIIVADSLARVYEYMASGENTSADYEERLRLKRDLEDLLRTQVETLLYPVFGDYAKVQPSVTLNFDRKLTESIEFEPVVDDEGIPVSLERLFEASRYDDEAEGVVGTDPNGMGTVEYPYEDLQDNETYRKYMETYNYEISQHTTQIEHEMGDIERLSVSVIVDDTVISSDYAGDIVDLVANAIGIADTELVTVAFMPFNAADTFQDYLSRQEEAIREIQTRQLVRTGIISGVILVIVILALLFLRSLLRSRAEERRAAELAAAGLAAGGAVDYIAGEEFEGLMEDSAELGFDIGGKSEGLLQLERYIDANPEAVAQLLRNWLTDE